jgi:hypothetical protein
MEDTVTWRELLILVGSMVLVAAALSGGGFALLMRTGWLP